jgi:hypothetical protein
MRTVDALGIWEKTWVVWTICSAVFHTSNFRLGFSRGGKNAAMFCM